ncbi:MAG: hypothetical protein WC071_09475, partial [Victivallaceae bacterium]
MNQIICKSFDELPDDVESFSPNPEEFEFIICPEVIFPILKWNDFRLETQTQFLPYNYRLKFLHPSLYCRWAFTNDGYAKLDTLRKLAKRGATITFIVDSQKENSLINACCFLGECFNDCRNNGMDLTNIPFPVKKADLLPHDWVWSCYWHNDFPERLDEKQSKEFIHTVDLAFPEYDSRYFPVKITGANEEGITAFSVRVGVGLVLIKPPLKSACKSGTVEVPAQDKILITVNEFPVRLNLADNLPRVKYNILYKGQTYSKQASGLSFLRLLTWCYASHGNNCFGFTISDELERIFIIKPDSTQEEIAWSCLFKTRNNQNDGSFRTTLNGLTERIVPDCDLKDEIRNAIV